MNRSHVIVVRLPLLSFGKHTALAFSLPAACLAAFSHSNDPVGLDMSTDVFLLFFLFALHSPRDSALSPLLLHLFFPPCPSTTIDPDIIASFTAPSFLSTIRPTLLLPFQRPSNRCQTTPFPPLPSLPSPLSRPRAPPLRRPRAPPHRRSAGTRPAASRSPRSRFPRVSTPIFRSGPRWRPTVAWRARGARAGPCRGRGARGSPTSSEPRFNKA